MTQPRRRWIDEVSDALIALGSTGSLDEIYDRISSRDKMDFIENPNWNATVRRTLEQNSSDSNSFLGNDDLFYSVNGIGNGIWGLR